jgi:hypothetical protein
MYNTKITKALAESVGEHTKHIVHFQSGHEKTWEGIVSNTIKVGTFTKMKHREGFAIAIDHSKVEWFEVHPEDNN